MVSYRSLGYLSLVVIQQIAIFYLFSQKSSVKDIVVKNKDIAVVSLVEVSKATSKCENKGEDFNLMEGTAFTVLLDSPKWFQKRENLF